MSHDANVDAKMQQEFERLARVTRAWFGTQRDSEPAPAWLMLERAMRRQQRRSSRVRVFGGLALVFSAGAAVIGVGGLLHREAIVTYHLSGVSSDQGGTEPSTGAAVIEAGAAQAWLSFSDGSEVVLQPGARGRVVATTAHGARVQLDGGSARFSIRHLPGTEWSVAAGPFVVIVHGTVFDVGWSPASEELRVGLISGAVTVRGPMAGGAVSVRPGQRLTARASKGQTRIEGLADVEAPLAPVVEPIPAPPIQPPTTGAAPEPGRSDADDPTVASRSRVLAVREISANWAARVAAGAFHGVVADAHRLGIRRCLAVAPAASLAALADAARYARRPDLAQQALLAERRRFAGTVGAHDAAFLLGRLAEDGSGDRREALRWYDRYLDEVDRAHGSTYAAEALGRRMLALEHLGWIAEARATAAAYLRDFPEGPHAGRAEHLTRP